ncbi:hypothetical protein LLQ54_23695 [Rouxiella badensis]|uniref:hypothetical protein n=1 Tax=Rouxiella badensis TaxID=1646377 RepID=UPI001D13A11C|nr:hypothetical protein [Rouxiella badensis]MCC3721646.1 hypothetical protein [Rouxiella badensis]MCC3731285.1 hypothetical protein [Rouxiella badensis]MCC3742863.1 hypothetical protein [Rouxiella badensis]
MNIKNINNFLACTLSPLLLAFSMSSHAELVNKNPNMPINTVLLISDVKGERVQVKTFNTEAMGCNVLEGMMKIERVILDEDDRHTEKMTFRDMNNKKTTMPVPFSLLSNVERSWADDIFQENDWVLLQYEFCGSGGFPDVITITKHTNRFPKAGINISELSN